MSRLFIFDYDGTLCATREAICLALSQVFQEWLGEAADSAQIVELVGRGIGLRQTMLALHPEGTPPPADELDTWQNRYRAIYDSIADEKVTAFPGAVEAVSACAAEGNVAVVSNKGKAALEHSLAQLGFAAHVQAVFADDGHSPRKPDPALYSQFVCTKFPHTSAEDTLMIGDTDADLQFAKNAGLRSCWAQYGYGNPAACLSIGYDHRIGALGELPVLLDQLLS